MVSRKRAPTEEDQMELKYYLMQWRFLAETENIFNVIGFPTQRLARGSPFQHSPLKPYNTTAVQMGVESKPAASLHPPANYLQGDRILIKILWKKLLSTLTRQQGTKGA